MVMSLVAKGAMNAARNAAVSRQSVRALSTSTVLNKDLVQEAYLRELKSYKAPAKSADAHKGQVREFHQPKAPQAPQAPDVSSELKAFESSEPDHAEHVASAAGESAAAGPRQDVNAFLEEARKPIEPEHH